MEVSVEIIPPTLTLSVSSANLRFGQIPQNVGQVEIDPVTGERSEGALGVHIMSSILLAGTEGAPFTVMVSPPMSLDGLQDVSTRPLYSVQWAHSSQCEPASFVQIPDTQIMQEQIGQSGCSHIRFGGVLVPNQSLPGRYSAVMTVHIMQI